ncbi:MULTISPECIES: hypothetical protein [unclassified Saccharibacter]|uniref:hypothetical protein n=1 Tax=unclassified Saccharibacter TaxID=2648722 RepID=UPI00132624B0|nr:MULTISPECIES: hypothetical protein [unclassified Saccharibacter]MXV35809.1 hypothetical protein [Saccharibacter sp. EH611]MXV57930.1 hypothetical protein [Saccharibacter sp. EH70]MXV66325.1 hypothetical protein [Saccharibacter sp. EH60]
MTDAKNKASTLEEIAANYLDFSVMITHAQLRAATKLKKSKQFKVGMLRGALNCLWHTIPMHHPEVSEEDIIKIAQFATDNLCKNPAIKKLIGG